MHGWGESRATSSSTSSAASRAGQLYTYGPPSKRNRSAFSRWSVGTGSLRLSASVSFTDCGWLRPLPSAVRRAGLHVCCVERGVGSCMGRDIRHGGLFSGGGTRRDHLEHRGTPYRRRLNDRPLCGDCSLMYKGPRQGRKTVNRRNAPGRLSHRLNDPGPFMLPACIRFPEGS